MAKAFYRVWHKGLLHKLILANTPLHLVQLIQSFHVNRTFQIQISKLSLLKSHNSRQYIPRVITRPLLYAAYINDIPTIPKVNVALFADDIMYFTNDKNQKFAVACLQRQIKITEIRLNKWRLKLNGTKSTAIIFDTKIYQNLQNLIINRISIDWSTKAKYLGILLDRWLKMNAQVINLLANKKEPEPRYTQCWIWNVPSQRQPNLQYLKYTLDLSYYMQ